MTTLTHPGTEHVRRAALRDLVRRAGAVRTPLVRRLRAAIHEFAASGQLGPDPEIEVGRWTGARV
jgi:hypothetical protein